MEILCVFCEKPVDPNSRNTCRRVQGWERNIGTRASGKQAGSDIVLREPLDDYAHYACVRLEKDGIGVGQGSMFGENGDGE